MNNLKKHAMAPWLGLALFGLLNTIPAMGSTVFGFEDYTGTLPTSPAMTSDGWYVPNVANTNSPSVYRYADYASAGIVADPVGGNNFLALATTPTGTSRKAQRHVTFGAAIWTISYDLSIVNAASSGNTYDTDYIGSFAPQSTTANFSSFYVVNGWDDTTTGSTWSAFYDVYDASGNPLNGGNGVTPGAAWTGLSQNHWYIESTTFNAATNAILSVSITDMATHLTTTDSPSGWYMNGGSTPLAGLDSIRFRGYGSTNAMLIDNVTLDSSVPEPAALALSAAGLALLTLVRRRARAGR